MCFKFFLNNSTTNSNDYSKFNKKLMELKKISEIYCDRGNLSMILDMAPIPKNPNQTTLNEYKKKLLSIINAINENTIRYSPNELKITTVFYNVFSETLLMSTLMFPKNLQIILSKTLKIDDLNIPEFERVQHMAKFIALFGAPKFKIALNRFLFDVKLTLVTKLIQYLGEQSLQLKLTRSLLRKKPIPTLYLLFTVFTAFKLCLVLTSLFSLYDTFKTSYQVCSLTDQKFKDKVNNLYSTFLSLKPLNLVHSDNKNNQPQAPLI